MVGFDSTILPGREGKITQQINIEGLHGGEFKKSVDVTSNATNTPSLSLIVMGVIKPLIDISSNYLRIKINPDKNGSEKLVFKTEKSDLQVKEITFKSNAGEQTPGWQGALPIYIKQTMTRSDKPDSLNRYEYTVVLSLTYKEAEGQFGEFSIKTNHPIKDVLQIRGSIETK